MKIKVLVLALTIVTALIGTADWAADFPLSRSLVSEWQWGGNGQSQPLLKDSILDARETDTAFQARSLAILEKVAAADLEGLDTWWRTRSHN